MHNSGALHVQKLAIHTKWLIQKLSPKINSNFQTRQLLITGASNNTWFTNFPTMAHKRMTFSPCRNLPALQQKAIILSIMCTCCVQCVLCLEKTCSQFTMIQRQTSQWQTAVNHQCMHTPYCNMTYTCWMSTNPHLHWLNYCIPLHMSLYMNTESLCNMKIIFFFSEYDNNTVRFVIDFSFLNVVQQNII